MVPKKNKKLRMVIDLQDLNRVTLQDVAVPPDVETLAESCGGRACYTELDLFVAFDQRQLDEKSRDLTTIQTPLGTFRMTVLPMGYTNSMQILHNDITFILQDEIPHVTNPFIDDVPVLGPRSRYRNRDGSYETLPDSPGVRRFVYEHLCDVNRILHWVGSIGGTFSAKKFRCCVPDAVFVGHKLTENGREADDTKVQRVRDWPPCETLTDVRAFLGTVGVLRVFIRDFARKARALHRLTKKEVPFEWGEKEQASMDALKEAVIR